MQVKIEGGGTDPITGAAVILVPEEALIEAGFIRMLAANQTAQSKHEFQALAQTARMLAEDGELAPTTVKGTLRVSLGDQTLDLDRGLLIVRRPDGDIALLSNSGQPARKYLEAAHRYCTRWIRLDL